MAGAPGAAAHESQLAQLWVTKSGQTSPLPQHHTSHSQSQRGVRRELEGGSALARYPLRVVHAMWSHSGP